MKLGSNPLSHQAELKYSERQNAVWAIVDLGEDNHISFYPSGPGAEDYNQKMLGIISDWAQEHGEWSARNRDWFKLWMLNDLPFDMFHVTIGGKHFYFQEDGTVLGESTPKGAITALERERAWQLSGYALNGQMRPLLRIGGRDSHMNRTTMHPHSLSLYEGREPMEEDTPGPYSPSWPVLKWSQETQSFSKK